MVALQIIEKEMVVFSKERMRERREQLKLNQNEASVAAKIHRNQWANYENGLSRPASETLVLIANALDCSVDYLLGLSDSPNSLRGLPDDERRLLENYQVRRLALEREIINEEIDKI